MAVSSSKTKPNCVKGTACGWSCISGKLICRSEIKANIAKALVQTAKASSPLSAKIPKDVTVSLSVNEDGDRQTQYSFSVEGNRVNFVAVEDKNKSNFATIDFDVNDNYTSDSSISDKAKTLVAIKVARIMKYDASKRPDGFQYETNATIGDEYAAKRTLAFQSLGFSGSSDGRLGGDQNAIVNKGVMAPDYSKSTLSEADRASRIEELKLLRSQNK